MKLLGLATAVAAGVLALHGTATAGAPTCASLDNPLYLQVGDTQNNLMKRLGRKLRDDAAHPVTLVWVTSGSCTNIAAIENDTPVTVNMQYVPSIAEDPAWVPSSPTLPCTVPVGGQILDVANSALFNSACTTTPPLPATIGAFQGPVQAYVLAVPEASSQIAITMEQAYFVFGFGAAGMASPWDDENEMFIRGPTKSTLLAWAANIQVPPNKWHGVVPQTPTPDSSPAVVQALQTAPDAEKAIGILGVEVYDANRATLDELAYRAPGQYLAYYPDSTPNATDKINVRDGHYTVWSPTIWMTDVDNGGVPLDADAKRVIDMIVGLDVTPAPNFVPIDVEAQVGLVPECAMKVNRDFEGGDLRLYDPPEPCGCRFESVVATTSCSTCDGVTPCATGTCRNGYCEEH